MPDDTLCLDNTVCNGDETCQSGVCTDGTPLETDDNDSCTADACDPITGVSHTYICDLTTYTQGGWGSKPNGNNPGQFLSTNFGDLGGNLVVGIGNAATYTSASAVANGLPTGGTAGALNGHFLNPLEKTNTRAGVLLGQTTSLELNVSFSDLGLLLSIPQPLGDFIVKPGLGLVCDGETVRDVLETAERILGGTYASAPIAGATASSINACADLINKNFDNGNDLGNLI